MILVVDDDKSIRLSLKLVLERNGYEVALADNPKAAMQVIWDVPAVELVLMDMNYSNSTDGEEGLTLLKQIKVFRPDVPCILMTAWGTIDLAVQGMRAGAFDFITKPWDNGVLLDRIETATQIQNSSQSSGAGGTKLRIKDSTPSLGKASTNSKSLLFSAFLLDMSTNSLFAIHWRCTASSPCFLTMLTHIFNVFHRSVSLSVIRFTAKGFELMLCFSWK